MKNINTFIYYILVGIVSILLLNRLFLIFSYNLDLGGLENYFSFLALKVGSGEMYTHPESYPFMVTQYPPLYLHLTHALSSAINLFTKDEVRAIYISGRILNLLFNIATIALVFKFFKNRLKFNFKKAAMPSLLIFTIFIEHAYAVRMDSLKMLLVVAFYIQGYKYYHKGSTTALVLLILIGFLALVAKQDALVHIGILGLLYFCFKKFIDAFKFGVPIAFLFLLFSYIICDFSWEIFYLNFVVGISQGVDFEWAKMVYNWNPIITFAQLFMVITMLIWGVIKERKDLVFAILLTLIYVFATLNILKWGSNINYYFEFQILIICLFSYWMQNQNTKALKVVFYGAMVAFLVNNVWNQNLGLNQFSEEKTWRGEYKMFKSEAHALEKVVEEDGGSKIIVFSRPLSLMLANRVVMGTTANEYPEWQFPYVKTLPRRTYDYHLNCNSEQTNLIRFITWDEVDEFHKNLLREMFDTNVGLNLIKKKEFEKYNVYLISCTE